MKSKKEITVKVRIATVWQTLDFPLILSRADAKRMRKMLGSKSGEVCIVRVK